MRSILALVSTLACAASCLAAERNLPESPKPSPALRNQAQIYATQLHEILQIIAREYVRPVSRAELAEAALRGLYEAAQVPVPATLRAEVQQALATHQLREFLAGCREKLGESEALRGAQALHSSLQTLLPKLDPYSAVIRKDKSRPGDLADSNAGLGLELVEDARTHALAITSVLPGGPAQKAGLRPGDQITHVQGHAGNDLPAAQEILQADRLEVTVLRPTTQVQRKVLLKRESFKAETVLGVRRHGDQSWDYFLDAPNRIAHVRLGALGAGTSWELQQVLRDLHTAHLRGLILDLRWCPGGLLREAAMVADLFLPEGTPTWLLFPSPTRLLFTPEHFLGCCCPIATVNYRAGRQDLYLKRGTHTSVGFPLVVLVNSETLGGGELIAAALQDNRRAFVAGQRTFGKASVQSLLNLPVVSTLTLPVPNLELKLSSGLFLRPSGKNLDRFPESTVHDSWGVVPDAGLDCRVSAALSHQLRDWWTWQTLRPARSEEALPLDDPALDPQRGVAWHAVLRLLKEAREQ